MSTERPRVRDFVSADEARALCAPSNAQGARAVLASWALIAGAFALCIRMPGIASYALALCVLGGRQLALAILMHEASHRTLFASRALNDWVGTWLCAAPTWNHLEPYRKHHLEHHRHTGSERDPDLSLVTPFPTTKLGLLRKLARDVLGVSGLRRVLGLVLMDVGVLAYTASGDMGRMRDAPRGLARARFVLERLGPVLATNLALWGVLAALGHGRSYLLWVAAYLSTYSLFLRLRAMAEHAATDDASDPFRNTRTTLAGPLARLTVAPHHVNYHLEHHLLMGVPQHNLPRFHALLRARGALEHACVENGYLAVLRKMLRKPGVA